MIYQIAVTGQYDIRLPQWGRCFWQDPTDRSLFLAYGSGSSEVDFISSSDSGNTWSEPSLLFPVEDFDIHNNFDVVMDRVGNIHCGFRYNGSGCYQFVQKNGSSWDIYAGLGPMGLCTAGDVGNAKGFQGSLTTQEAPYSTELAGVSFPAVKIAAKNSSNEIVGFAIGTPFTGNVKIDLLEWDDNTVGEDGGYPIIYIASPGASQITYYDAQYNAIKRWLRDDVYYYSYDDIELNATEVPFGPNMCISSGIGNYSAGLVLTCSSGGQSFYSNVINNETYRDTTNYANGTDNYWRGKAGYYLGDPSGYIVNSGVVPTGSIWGVGSASYSMQMGLDYDYPVFPGAGTNCDISFNDNGNILFYFQTKNANGKQCIGRFTGMVNGSIWTFYPVDDVNYGLKYIAQVGKSTTGGGGSILFWGGFKALKHPTEPDLSHNKEEMIVTQGCTNTYPIGGILTVWDVAESPGLQMWQLPTHSVDYTITSGTLHEIFKGVTGTENVLPTHASKIPFIFDNKTQVETRVMDGYVIKCEFDEPREVDRVEIVHRNLGTTSQPAVAISGSLDGVNWTRMIELPSGIVHHLNSDFNNGYSLLKYQSRPHTQWEYLQSLNPVNSMEPFVTKYMRLLFELPHSSTKYVYEMKFFGPDTFNPEILTWSNQTSDPPPYYSYAYIKKYCSEPFRIQSNTVPVGWTTYGDFTWGVVGSGASTLGNRPPSSVDYPKDYNGTVPSGFFSYIINPEYKKNGNGDCYSLMSWPIADANGVVDPYSPYEFAGHAEILPGQTGVVETSVYITTGEHIGAVYGRTISFDVRTDEHPNDLVQFFVRNPSSISPYSSPTGALVWQNTGGIPTDWMTVSTLLTAGTNTLRWVYKRGATTKPFTYGCAWIDNVVGLDGGPQPAIRGFVRGSNAYETGVVYGYLNSKGASSINGVIPLVDPASSNIHGYLFSQANINGRSSIHGFTKGNGQFIRGYVLGSPSGITEYSIPLSNINGYVVGAPWITSSINGYVCDLPGNNIYGYLRGYDLVDSTDASGSLSINGFVIANYPTSSIHGIVNASGQNTTLTNIYGYLNSNIDPEDRQIYGYVGGIPGSGLDSTINGVLLGWNEGPDFFRSPQSMIYGYLGNVNDYSSGNINGYLLGNYPVSQIYGYLGNQALVASGGGTVAGGPGSLGGSTSNVVAGTNFTYGYLKGYNGDQIIYGYVKRPLAENSQIYGYVLSGATDNIILGYLSAHDISSGIFYGYASGVGFGDIGVHGYAAGISGIENFVTYGYTLGAMHATSDIPSYLIGITTSSGLCSTHDFPIQSIPTVIIPSGNFFNPFA